MSTVIEVTDATFDAVVLQSPQPVLVDYWADWCGPCKQLSPVIDDVAREHGDKITFAKLDTNAHPETAATQNVMGLPTLQVFVGGQLVKTSTGAKSKAALLKFLKDYL